MSFAQGSLQSQIEHLQLKYTGTGHPDISKHDWLVNQHRDTYSSFIGHSSIIDYFSVAQNESIGRLKYQYLSKSISPCGPPPKENINFLLKDVIKKRKRVDEQKEEFN